MELAKTFSSKRFLSLFTIAGMGLIVEYIRYVADTIIGGQLIGQEAIAGITLITPLFTIMLCLSFMMAVGSNILISTALGDTENKKISIDKASQLMSQSILLILIMGFLTTLIFMVGKSFFLSLFDGTPNILKYASDYYSYLAFLPVPLMFASFLYEFVMNRGNEKICLMASFSHIFVSILLSFILCKYMGTAGLSLGAVIATCLGDLVYLFHFKTKRHTLHWKPYLNLKSILTVFKLGLGDAVESLYGGLLLFALNLFALNFFGNDALIILAIVFNFWAFIFSCNDAFDEVTMPLVCTYNGERNHQGLRSFMYLVIKGAFIEQLFIIMGVMIFAEQIPTWFNLKTDLIQPTATALRIVSLAGLFFTLSSVLTTYYVYLLRFSFALVLLTITQLILPVISPILLGIIFGINGIWWGFLLSGILGVISIYIGCLKKYPQNTFPFLLDKKVLAHQHLFNIQLNDPEIYELSEKLKSYLDKGSNQKFVFILKTIKNHNKNSKKIALECTITQKKEGTQIILRDTGRHYQITTYEFDRALKDIPKKEYTLSGGYNRLIIWI